MTKPRKATPAQKAGIKSILRGFRGDYLKNSKRAKNPQEKQHWLSEVARVEREIMKL